MTDQPEHQRTLEDWPTSQDPTQPATDHPKQTDPQETNQQTSNPHQDNSIKRTARFDLPRHTLGTPPNPHPLTEDAVDALIETHSAAPPLADTIDYLATHEPQPTTRTDRAARALYILARAAVNALPGYSLTESMVPLRDTLEETLDIRFKNLENGDYIVAKRIAGHEKYYRLTTTGRNALLTYDHPNPGVLSDTHPVLQDGPVHNRTVLDTADWLTARNPSIDAITAPTITSDAQFDILAHTADDTTWTAEVIAAEDDREHVVNRVRHLAETPGQSLLVMEDSDTAVDTFDALDLAGEIDVPDATDYHKYSVAQLRERVLPDISHAGIDHIQTLSTIQ